MLHRAERDEFALRVFRAMLDDPCFEWPLTPDFLGFERRAKHSERHRAETRQDERCGVDILEDITRVFDLQFGIENARQVRSCGEVETLDRREIVTRERIRSDTQDRRRRAL